MSPGNEFRELLASDGILQALGGYDGLSAKVIESVGGDVAYMSGSAVSTSVHGNPDVGLTTMSEMVDRARTFTEAVDVPVFCDADTGYGNPLNVRRTVERYEAAGVAAIHLEDQEFPKQCGHFDGKRVVPVEEMERKLEAATDAREDLVIVARTDAGEQYGLAEAIDRGRAYRDAGADVLFIEAPETREELEEVAAAFPDTPLLANMVEGGKTPLVPADELAAIGFDVALYPTTAQKAAARAMEDVFEEILTNGSQEAKLDELYSWRDRNELTGLDRIRDLEDRYAIDRPGGESAADD